MRQFMMTLIALATMASFGVAPLVAQQQQQQERQERQQASDSIAGTIVEKDRNTLTVHSEEQESMTFQVNDQTRILDETGQMMERREEDPLAELNPGEWVVVHYRTAEEEEYIAVSIERRVDNGRQADAARAQPQRQDPQPAVTPDPQQRQQDPQQRQQQNLQQEQERLPATSGALPLVAGLGLLGLLAAGALGYVARREH